MSKLKDKVIFEWKSMRHDVTIVEYIFWWIVRICLIYGIFKIHDEPDRLLVVGSNLLGSFAFTMLRYICPKNSFMCRTSYRVQTIIEFTIFTGCFLLHCTSFYSTVGLNKYDFWLHLVSGCTIFIVGYYLTLALDKDNTANASIKVIGATGFAFTTAIAWEIMEFTTDFILGSNNQNYTWDVESERLWNTIFTKTAAGPDQYPVMDTMGDIILATISTVISAVVLFIILKRREKNNKIQNKD